MNLLHLNFRQRIFALVWLRRLLWLPPLVMLWRWQTWPFLAILTVVLVLLLVAALKAWEQSLRRRFIREAELPRFLAAKLRAAHPGLSARDADLVLHGLRQFFLAHLRSGRQFVGMPSKVVDTACTSSSCTPRATSAGVTPPLAVCCTTRLPRCWGATRAAMTDCGAPGTGPAARKASTRASRAGCPCCSRWTPSWV